MKRLLLALMGAVSLSASFDAFAQNHTYIYFDELDNPMFGTIRRISPNGQWATGGDESDETGSIIINTQSPENPILETGGLLLDIDDSGMAVGAYYESIGYAKYKRAAIYKDGKWNRLPLPEEIIGQSHAVAISADSKVIAGHGMCLNEEPDEPGKYFPMIWRLNEQTGEYELDHLFNNLYLPGTFGFFIQDMTPDGRILCGYQCLDMGDVIAATLDIETGKYTIWHKIDYKEVEFEFMGSTYYKDCMFVDGLLDGFDENVYFAGGLYYATNNYLFGSRSIVSEVNEDGSGVITTLPTVYDIENGNFIDGPKGASYSCGVSPDKVFTASGKIINGSKSETVTKFVGTGDQIDIIYSIDNDMKVLGGSYVALTPWGEQYESPVLVVLEDAAFSGIADVSVNAQAKVTISGNTINVEGATNTAVYTINGALVSTAASTDVAAGIYVVVADGNSYKVIVK